jgi:ELWxxDGT repeat protein
VLFIANDGRTGKELWRTDGTEEGTQLVRDIYEGADSTEPYAFCVVGGSLFFSAREDSHGEELWRYDGATGEVTLVADIAPGPQHAAPYNTVALGDIVVFTANHPDTGEELWRSDGTAEGTVLIADIFDEYFTNPSSSPTELTPVESGLLFFVVNDLEHGAELWVTDGTSEGTRMVRDIYPGIASSDPRHLTELRNIVFFEADDGFNGRELWRSDGTEGGTALALDFWVGETGSGIQEMVTFDRSLFVVASKPETGEELFVIVLDDAGKQVGFHGRDIRPGPESSHPRGLTVVPSASRIYFRANDDIHGEELWYVTGSSGYETRMVRDIVPAPRIGAKFEETVPFQDGVAAVIDDRVHGAELWRVQGEYHRAEMIKDLRTEHTLSTPRH